MRMTRVFVPCALASGALVELPAEPAAHLAKVLRARGGDELILFNGDGREFAGAIEAVRGSRVTASVGLARSVERESPLAVTLVQCIPRGDRMDFIVQKATELGVARIQPVLSQRSVVRLDARQTPAKTSHWRAVAVSACEQCGRNWLPQIEPPRPLIEYLGAGLPAAGVPGAGGAPPADSPCWRLVLEPGAAGAAPPGAPCGAVEVAIGPEGGFAADELDAFDISGFHRLGLGPRILRSETAAIAALVWLQTRFGDMG